MQEHVTPATVVAFLRSKGWLSDREIVTQGISIVDISRSHYLYRVDIEMVPRWVIKCHRPARGDFDGNFVREQAAYELGAKITELGALMPAFYGKVTDAAIAIEAVTGKTGWDDADTVQTQQKLASGLGRLHRATQGKDIVAQQAVFPWILKAMDFDSPDFVWEGPSRSVLQRVAEYPGAAKALRSARGQWDWSCLIHGDTKLDNAIVTDDIPQRVALVDWEHCGLGDPLWDLAGLSLRAVYEAAALAGSRAYFEPLSSGLAANLEAYSWCYGKESDLAKFVLLMASWVIQSACTSVASGHSRLHDLYPVIGVAGDMLTLSEEWAAALRLATK